MKRPIIDWENSSDEFIANFQSKARYQGVTLDRDDVEDIITADMARAQRMASAGLRHLRAILGARRPAGKLDRWRRDALAPRYFGSVSSVGQIERVKGRLSEAHRILRDKRLRARMREQRHGSTDTTRGRNAGGFFSNNVFQLFPNWANSNPTQRSAILVHELLHQWLSDQEINGETVYTEALALELARRKPSKARRNPENFERFILQVWKDEGLEAPSGAILNDLGLAVTGAAASGATGLLRDRPVLAGPAPHKRQDLVFCALRAEADELFVPTLFEVDATPMQRRTPQGETAGRASYPPACCSLTNGIVIAATRSPQTRRMELRAWDIVDEGLVRLAESGTLFRDCFSQPDVIALGPDRFCLTYKIKNGRMRVELMDFTRNRGFRRIAHAETHGPVHDHGRAVLVSPIDSETGEARPTSSNEFVVATGFRTREGKLSFDLWQLDTSPARVTRRGGLVDAEITGRPSVAMARRGRKWVVVAAARDKTTRRLRLTSYDPSDPARPRQLADNGETGARMTHSPDIVTVKDGPNIAVVTAQRYVTGGRAIVSLWRAGTRQKLFIREHDSGGRDTPSIKGSPSLVPLAEKVPPVLITSAVGPDDRLSLLRWEVRDPVRTNR